MKQNRTIFFGVGCSGPKPEVELVLQEGGICIGRREVYSSEKIMWNFKGWKPNVGRGLWPMGHMLDTPDIGYAVPYY